MFNSKYAKLLLIVLVIVLVGGGIFAYYLKDKIGQVSADQTGSLAGQVTLKPLCAEELQGKPCGASDLYRSREVIAIANSVFKREVARTHLSPFGEYQLELPPGEYTIDINHIGVDSSKELPKQVVIKKGEINTFNFTIDTGIH
jgi:hypothetical protein